MSKDNKGHGSEKRGSGDKWPKGKDKRATNYPKKELRKFGKAQDLLLKTKPGTYQHKAMKQNRSRLQGKFREALAKR